MRRQQPHLLILAFVAIAGWVIAQPASPPAPAVWFEDLVDVEPLAVSAREDLARHLSGRVVDSFVVRLRRYIEPDPSRPRHILSVRGHGYRFLR